MSVKLKCWNSSKTHPTEPCPVCRADVCSHCGKGRVAPTSCPQCLSPSSEGVVVEYVKWSHHHGDDAYYVTVRIPGPLPDWIDGPVSFRLTRI